MSEIVTLKNAFSHAVKRYGENENIRIEGFGKKMERAGAVASAVRAKGKPILIDIDKLEQYYEEQNNPLAFKNVCDKYNITNSRLTYVCMKHNIQFNRVYKKRFFKNEEDKNNAVRLSKK